MNFQISCRQDHFFKKWPVFENFYTEMSSNNTIFSKKGYFFSEILQRTKSKYWTLISSGFLLLPLVTQFIKVIVPCISLTKPFLVCGTFLFKFQVNLTSKPIHQYAEGVETPMYRQPLLYGHTPFFIYFPNLPFQHDFAPLKYQINTKINSCSKVISSFLED